MRVKIEVGVMVRVKVTGRGKGKGKDRSKRRCTCKGGGKDRCEPVQLLDSRMGVRVSVKVWVRVCCSTAVARVQGKGKGTR